uniref:HAT C-terminal dimerisation domain-containing protein n=1 Tax=Neogobius melanostomus TaxID=47308 RepID=A0A8C6SSN1_9GOBI
MAFWKSFKTSQTQGDVLQQLHSASAAEILERRQYLHRILAVTSFLGQQGIPFRGHNEHESSQNQGNFIECMKLLKKFDPFLKNYSSTCHATYLSHFSQNEMITSISKEITTNICDEIKSTGMYAVMSRAAPRQKQRKFAEFVVQSSCGSSSNPTSSADFRCQIFYPCIDRMLKELAHRFSGVGEQIMSGIEACNPLSESFLAEEKIDIIAKHYKIVLRPEELLVAKHFLKRRMETQSIQDMATVFKLLDVDMFPTLHAVLKAALTIPVSSCSVERSFSALRRLHTWLRRTMGQERLNDLAVMTIEKQYLNEINPEKVIDSITSLKL